MLGRMAELRPCSGRTEVQEPISTDRSGEDAEFTSLRSVNINMCNSVDVQLVPNSTTRTRPDQTRPDEVRGLCRKPAWTRRSGSPTKIFGSAQRDFDISKFVDMLKRFAVITTVSPGGLQPCARGIYSNRLEFSTQGTTVHCPSSDNVLYCSTRCAKALLQSCFSYFILPCLVARYTVYHCR